jgi:hypothetical protein
LVVQATRQKIPAAVALVQMSFTLKMQTVILYRFNAKEDNSQKRHIMPFAYKFQLNVNELKYVFGDEGELLGFRPFRVLFIYKPDEDISYAITSKDVVPQNNPARINSYTHAMNQQELMNLYYEIDNYEIYGDQDLLGKPLEL